MIDIRSLEKVYDDESGITNALSDINFSIEKGEFVSIMGPSGSGKSTLLHILSFLDRPTGGTYLFSGKSIHDLSDVELARVRNKEMGFVFQSFNLMARASVYENIELPLLYSDTPVSERKAKIDKALADVDLSEQSLQIAGTLSGGQKQRVAIARALVNDPNVIFADEPTGNLDSKSGAQVMEIFKRLHESGRTIVLVTHETKTAEFGQRLISIRDGKVEFDRKITGHIGTPESLK
jgi:putative ABC transport system ATP-binding protein